jgi:hypothetical protein
MSAKLKLKGQQFSLWTVLHSSGKIGRGQAWLCRCRCGTERRIDGSKLTSGQSKSCGCTRLRRTLAARFLRYVDKHGPFPSPEAIKVHTDIAGTRCWLWTSSQTASGYGFITEHIGIGTKRRGLRAHRVAWFVNTGLWPIPMACHKCDNKLCVRFSHLFQGTNKDNMKDMLLKERGKKGKHYGK